MPEEKSNQPSRGPENPCTPEEECRKELARKKMLGAQATEMFSLLGRLIFSVIIISFVAILTLMIAEAWQQGGLFESRGHLTKSTGSLFQILKKHLPGHTISLIKFLIVLLGLIFAAWILVIRAIYAINKPSVSKDLNRHALVCLQAARLIIFAVSASSVWVISTFGLQIAGMEELWILLSTLALVMAVFMLATGYATWVALKVWNPQSCKVIVSVITMHITFSVLFVLGAILHLWHEMQIGLWVFAISMILMGLLMLGVIIRSAFSTAE